MNNKEPLLRIQFDGEAVGAARIPVAHLLRFLSNLTKALLRTGRVLQGDGDSVRRGPHPASIKDEVALELTVLTHGSPSAVLGFERAQPRPSFPQIDVGMEILEAALGGLKCVQGDADALPPGYDTGVLMAWRDAGVLFRQGIDCIQFSLNHRETPIVADFTPAGFARIQTRIQGPLVNIRTIEGRLLMADFKEHGTRCRVHPSVGDPVLCLFDDEKRDEVLDDILQFVRIVGEAKEDPVTGNITSIQIHNIERLEERENDDAQLLPQGSPLPHDFWSSPSLEELAVAQGVQPLANVELLFGTWPGEPDDGFEAAIDALRHDIMAGDGSR